MTDLLKKTQELVDEFNKLETRQREIIGALQLLKVMEEEQKVKVEVKDKKNGK